MNNATIALNVARPAAPTPSPTSGVANASSVTGKANDDTASNKRFDAAMDAAHADARKARDPSPDKGSSTTSTTTSTAKDAGTDKTVSTQAADKKPDDDATKKDDATDGDTSLATSVLALIGVPPTVSGLAAKALATATATAGKLGDALGSITGAATTPGLAAAADATAGTKDGAPAGLTTMDALAVATPVATVTASPFAALLAAQGGDLSVTKDDGPATDPSNASPMPLLHAPAMNGVAGPAVQVQATQAATSPQFGQELGEQIAWMGSGDVKSARIKLHPEELGSMDVHVTMDGGKVNVAILAQHPAAVHAVQQTLSQLDTMLAHHGLSLGQADVGQRNPGQNAASGDPADGQGAAADDGTATTGAVATSHVSRSLLDEVA
jgi:flagellar hook-length control protein FliK